VSKERYAFEASPDRQRSVCPHLDWANLDEYPAHVRYVYHDCSASAWDTVEELSAAASHAKDNAQKEDPLEKFCEDDPSADECRVYED